jgi:hypothetical protein
MARVLGRQSRPLGRRAAGWQHPPHAPRRSTDPHGVSSATPELALPGGPNATWEEGWRGRFSTPGGEAVVRIGARSARMDLPAGRKSAGGALRATAYLPGNLRFAGPPHRLSLRADSWLTTDSLAASVDEFRLGVRRVRPRRRPLRPSPAGGGERFEALLDELDRADSTVDLVPLDSGWELGARMRGGRVPVRVSPVSKGLRLHRIVIVGDGLGNAAAGRRGLLRPDLPPQPQGAHIMIATSTLYISDLSQEKRYAVDLGDELSVHHDVDQTIEHFLSQTGIPRNDLDWSASSRGVRLDKRARLADLENADTSWTVVPTVSAGTP